MNNNNINNINGNEDEFVVVELPDIQGISSWNEVEYQMIGFDSDTPFLRIGHFVLKGEWRQTLGTNLILDPTSAEIKARSQRTLTFHLVELVEKEPDDRQSSSALLEESVER
jgi:hypothetical protein